MWVKTFNRYKTNTQVMMQHLPH